MWGPGRRGEGKFEEGPRHINKNQNVPLTGEGRKEGPRMGRRAGKKMTEWIESSMVNRIFRLSNADRVFPAVLRMEIKGVGATNESRKKPARGRGVAMKEQERKISRSQTTMSQMWKSRTISQRGRGRTTNS